MPALAQEIGAVLAGARSLFWDVMEKGVAQAGSDLGIDVLVRSPINDDPQTIAQNVQLKLAQSFIAADVKGLILAPMPVTGVTTPIAFPVPVVFVDRSSSDFKAVSTIATDNHAGGRAAARSLQGRLPRGARVGVLRLAPYVVSTTARETGFVEAAREMGFEIVVDTYLGHGIREAQLGAADALDPQRGRVQAIFMPTSGITLGVQRALERWPAEMRPLLIGFDYRSGFEDSLRRGELYAMVMQDPFQMGYRAVQLLADLRSGKRVPGKVTVDVLVITAKNVDDITIRTSLRHYAE